MSFSARIIGAGLRKTSATRGDLLRAYGLDFARAADANQDDKEWRVMSLKSAARDHGPLSCDDIDAVMLGFDQWFRRDQ